MSGLILCPSLLNLLVVIIFGLIVSSLLWILHSYQLRSYSCPVDHATPSPAKEKLKKTRKLINRVSPYKKKKNQNK